MAFEPKDCEICDNNEMLREKCAYLAPWMKRIFWLVIPIIVTMIITTDTLKNLVPSFQTVGTAVNVVCFGCYGFFLLKMSSKEELYKTAGICRIVVAVLGVLSMGISQMAVLVAVSLASAGFSIVGEYREYRGHAAVTKGLDGYSSVDWDRLCRWFIVTFAAIPVSLLMMVMIPAMWGVWILALLAAIIGVIVVSIIKLVYIYRTAAILEEIGAGSNKNDRADENGK